MYYTSPSVTMDELEEHELDTWRSKSLFRSLGEAGEAGAAGAAAPRLTLLRFVSLRFNNRS